MKSCNLIIFALCLSTISSIADTGWLKIKAEPEPVTITINGKDLPYQSHDSWRIYTLPAGNYTLVAEKRYHTSQSKTIHLNGNDTLEHTFKFKEASGFGVEESSGTTSSQGRGDLLIITDLPGAIVRLNKEEYPKFTPTRVPDIVEGEWTVEVTLQGKTQSDVVLIRPGQLATVRFFFDPKKKDEYLAHIQSEKDAEQARHRQRLISDRMGKYRDAIKNCDLHFSIKGKNSGNTSYTRTSERANIWGDRASLVKITSNGRELRTSGKGSFRDSDGNEHHVSFEYYIDANLDYDERREMRDWQKGYLEHEFKMLIDGEEFIDKRHQTSPRGVTQISTSGEVLTFPWGTVHPNGAVGKHGTAIPKGVHDYAYLFIKLSPPTQEDIEAFRKRLEESDDPSTVPLPKLPGKM